MKLIYKKHINTLQERLIEHANTFGSIMTTKNSVNIEYLAGMEIITSEWSKEVNREQEEDIQNGLIQVDVEEEDDIYHVG